MKRISLLFLGILLLINFSCQKETKKELKVTQKKQSKAIVIVKRKLPLLPLTNLNDVIKKNVDFLKFYETLKPASYSLDELIDLTTKDLKLFRQMRVRRFKSKIDTAAVKSRLILTEINLKKLRFLLHRKKIESDTIEKTLNALVKSLNGTIEQMQLYNQSMDEFETILTHDSLAQIKKDSLRLQQEKIDRLQNHNFKDRIK